MFCSPVVAISSQLPHNHVVIIVIVSNQRLMILAARHRERHSTVVVVRVLEDPLGYPSVAVCCSYHPWLFLLRLSCWWRLLRSLFALNWIGNFACNGNSGRDFAVFGRLMATDAIIGKLINSSLKSTWTLLSNYLFLTSAAVLKLETCLAVSHELQKSSQLVSSEAEKQTKCQYILLQHDWHVYVVTGDAAFRFPNCWAPSLTSCGTTSNPFGLT